MHNIQTSEICEIFSIIFRNKKIKNKFEKIFEMSSIANVQHQKLAIFYPACILFNHLNISIAKRI